MDSVNGLKRKPAAPELGRSLHQGAGRRSTDRRALGRIWAQEILFALRRSVPAVEAVRPS
jgi:hypothetical protein